MNFPERYKADIVSAVESIDLEKIIEVIDLFKQARARGHNIFVCASTQCATTASRVLCDLLTCSNLERQGRFRMFAMNDREMESRMDEGVVEERLLVERLKNFAEPGDVVVGISASGKSAPILQAFDYSSRIGCPIVVFTGLDGGALGAKANIVVHVGSTNPGTVEDTHVFMCHMIGSYFLEVERLEDAKTLSSSR